MLTFLADENFNGRIVRGLRRRLPGLDVLLAQDAGLIQAADPVVLEWAARDGRILLTHDVRTMTRFAYERVAAGARMPGVLEVNSLLPIGAAVDELAVVAVCSFPGEWEDRVGYIPL